VQVWRVAVAAATAACIFGFRLGISLGYGLEFMPYVLALERGILIDWLLGLGFASKIILFQG
jgi:hypothetical protein